MDMLHDTSHWMEVTTYLVSLLLVLQLPLPLLAPRLARALVQLGLVTVVVLLLLPAPPRHHVPLHHNTSHTLGNSLSTVGNSWPTVGMQEACAGLVSAALSPLD